MRRQTSLCLGDWRISTRRSMSRLQTDRSFLLPVTSPSYPPLSSFENMSVPEAMTLSIEMIAKLLSPMISHEPLS
jgi:hypothetical protein